MTKNTNTKEKERVRVTPLPLKNLKKDGFTDKNDIFSYKSYGVMLADLFLKADGLNVALLDDDWGMGKTTFVKQWIGLMNNESAYECSVIYIDAFAKDFYPDPFMMLVAGINVAFPDKDGASADYVEEKKKFLECTKKIFEVLSKINLGVNLGGVSASVKVEEIMGVLFNDAKDEEDDAENKKSDAEKFECSLKKLVKTQKGPLIIVIDELDRCRPDFALRLLERIKHFFSVEGVSFLLVANMKQLSSMVESAYGFDGDDARVYLEKFYTVRLVLPNCNQHMGKYDAMRREYIVHLCNGMNLQEVDSGKYCLDEQGMELLETAKELSLRGIERIMTHIALIMAAGIGRTRIFREPFVTGLLITRLKNQKLYSDVLNMHRDMSDRDVRILWEDMADFLSLDVDGPLRDSGFLGHDVNPWSDATYYWRSVAGPWPEEKSKKESTLLKFLDRLETTRRERFNVLPAIARRIDGLLGTGR